MTDNSVQEFWQQHTAPAYHGLLSGNGWSWDEQRQGYRSSTGSWLTDADMDALARSILTSSEYEMKREAVSLLPAVGEWKPRLDNAVTTLMIVLGMFASGGEGGIDERVQGIIDGKPSTDEEVGYGIADAKMRLERFADELRGGDAGSNKQIVNRAGQYARGGWTIYEEARRLSHASATDNYGRKQFLFERNILDPNCDHCSPTKFTPGCPEITDQGWQPIGVLPKIGLRSCGPSCRCHWEYELLPDNLPE